MLKLWENGKTYIVVEEVALCWRFVMAGVPEGTRCVTLVVH